MKKTILRPKKEKKHSNNEIKEGYLDSDLDDPDNKKLYENVNKRIENNELDIYKNKKIEHINKLNNKKTERNNRYKELDKEKEGQKKLRRKTVDRGGKYNNIQSTYVIYSKRDIKFHIIEPSTASFDKPLIYDKNRKNKKETKGNVKVTYRSSCDNFKIKNKKKKKEKEKTVIYYHCAEIKQKDLDKYVNKKQKQKQINNINTIIVPKDDKKEENKKDIKDINSIENKIIKKELDKELNEEDIVKIVEAILSQITLNEIKNPKNIYINEIEKYLNKKEEEKKLKEIVNMMNTLKEKEKEEIIYILTYILNDNNEFIKRLKKEIGIKNENIEKLLDGYKSNIKELEDDKLEILTEKIITDIMKEYPLNENEKRIDMINKAANIIINLNKNDQEKILSTLNDINKNEYQKENINKLRDLVENLNNIRIYLFSISQNNLFKENNKDLSSKELDRVKSQIFNKKDLNNNNNIDKIALRLSSLSKNDQNNILNEINKKASESNNNISRKSINKLNRALKNIKLIKLFSSTIKKRKSIKKKAYDDNKIKEFNYNIYDKLTEHKDPTNWTEKLLIDKKEERKLQNLAQSLNYFDKENLRKTAIFANKNIINDKNKNDIEKLKNSLIMKNDNNFNKNMLSSQYFMMKSLGIIELNDVEINILKDTFSKDLFTDKIMDINKKEENLNLIANLIKELDEENQTKLLEKLENEQNDINKINLIKDLKDRVLKLNLLKDELREEKEENNINNINNYEDDLIEDSILDELDETMTVEISTDEIEENDIKDICQVFNVNYEDNEKEEKGKEKEKENNNINSIFEGSLLRLDDKSQKKLADKLEEKAKNNEDKEQLEGLIENLKKINNYKRLGNDIKSKREELKKEFLNEIDRIIKLNSNCSKNLDLNIIDELIKEIIKNLFENIIIDFYKNKIIEKYIIESKNEENLWKSAAKIVNLSNEDEKNVLIEIKNCDEKKQTNIYNKLYKSIEILKMIKNIQKNVELKKNDLIAPKINNLSPEDINEKLESFIQMLDKENVEKRDINNIVDELIKLDNINQELFINNLKEKIKNKNKDFIIKQIEKSLDKKKIQKTFAYKVLERYLKKIILEKEKNEKKYGICLDDNDKNRVILKKPNELNEDKFNEVKNNIMIDFKNIYKEKQLNDSSYLIEKEKKLEEIADVINSLDIDDKAKILEEIKNNLYKENMSNLYNEFMKALEIREKMFIKEKRERKDETIKEMEEKKKDDENNLLYSYIELKTSKNNNSSEIVIHEDEQEDDDNKENTDNKFTVNIGYLETEETY